MCIEGSPNGRCPITNYPFQPAEVVFILKRDEQSVNRGVPVPCFSFTGLRTIVTNPTVEKQGGFHDQLQREFPKMMMETEYAIYIIANEKQILEGMCQVPASAVIGYKKNRPDLPTS